MLETERSSDDTPILSPTEMNKMTMSAKGELMALVDNKAYVFLTLAITVLFFVISGV